MHSGNIEGQTVSEAERLADQTGKTVTIPNPPSYIPRRYDESPLSLPLGQRKAYRTPGPQEHYQLRVYRDHWTIEKDDYHPQHFPVQHAAFDAPMATIVALTILGSALS